MRYCVMWSTSNGTWIWTMDQSKPMHNNELIWKIKVLQLKGIIICNFNLEKKKKNFVTCYNKVTTGFYLSCVVVWGFFRLTLGHKSKKSLSCAQLRAYSPDRWEYLPHSIKVRNFSVTLHNRTTGPQETRCLLNDLVYKRNKHLKKDFQTTVWITVSD